MKGGNQETYDVLKGAIGELEPYTDENGTIQPYDETKKDDIVDSMRYFLNNKNSSNVLTKKEKTDLEKLLKKQIDDAIDDAENEYMSTLPNGVQYNGEDEDPKEGGRSRKRYKKRSSRRASRRKSRRASRRASRRRKASRRRRK